MSGGGGTPNDTTRNPNHTEALMSEQITTERVAETEEIGRAVYWALRTEMIEAADRREVDAPLLAEALKIEAIYQAARAAMAKASANRHRILYACGV
ncbi:hypothetical protein Srubr_27020 [Streptomyces rubradiris]|uniref:Uncharacterized protein n=2 Tax=Streptomyces rubradiris TaxID=285531 RepID=A0ABQ3RAH5_STRRR|nr:hypothetical protein Srubr_27020 [Streptomyces rubradiris]